MSSWKSVLLEHLVQYGSLTSVLLYHIQFTSLLLCILQFQSNCWPLTYMQELYHGLLGCITHVQHCLWYDLFVPWCTQMVICDAVNSYDKNPKVAMVDYAPLPVRSRGSNNFDKDSFRITGIYEYIPWLPRVDWYCTLWQHLRSLCAPWYNTMYI